MTQNGDSMSNALDQAFRKRRGIDDPTEQTSAEEQAATARKLEDQPKALRH